MAKKKISLIDAKTALDSHKTFYAQKWQSNGFYPIDKYVWNEAEKAYEHFTEKINAQGKRFWLSRGCPNGGDISNYDWLKYIFEHNAYALSFDKITDEHHYAKYQ